MINWTRKRQVSLVAHLIFLIIPLCASTGAAWMWWSTLFNSGWIASGIIATLEVLGISSLILYISRIEWPLAWLRHFIPFLSIIPLGYELLRAAQGATDGSIVASIAATLVTCWLIYIYFRLLHSLEHLFIDPVTAMREKAKEQTEGLSMTLAGWQTMTRDVEAFAGMVMASRQLTAPPAEITVSQSAMPLLTTSNVVAHPKMQLIVEYARAEAIVANERDKWLYTIPEIQKHTRCSYATVDVITRLVRSGQLTMVDSNGDGYVDS